MNWDDHKNSWPHADLSRFVNVDGTKLHVQHTTSDKDRPRILLLHGSGATTHSVAGLIDELQTDFAILAPDLPGHGFSAELNGGAPTLRRVARCMSRLCELEAFEPDIIVGHSAGAAIAVQMQTDGPHRASGIVSINGAFYPFPGWAGQVFPAAARLLFVNPLVPHLFAFGARNERRVRDLIASTGSEVAEEDVQFYARLLTDAGHVRGTLAMMANWDLEPMASLIGRLDVPLLQVIGGKDGTIPAAKSRETEGLAQQATTVLFPEHGHLVHEEVPGEVAEAIRSFASEALPGASAPEALARPGQRASVKS